MRRVPSILDEACDNEAFPVNEAAFAISMPEFLYIRGCSQQHFSPRVAIKACNCLLRRTGAHQFRYPYRSGG
jgi:hypothetical protein